MYGPNLKTVALPTHGIIAIAEKVLYLADMLKWSGIYERSHY